MSAPEDYAVVIPLPNHKKGDRWRGIASIGPVTINGTTPTASLVRLTMRLKHRDGIEGEDGSTTFPEFLIDSSSAPEVARDAPAVIDNAATWEANIPKIQNFVTQPGVWDWDMAFYDTENAAPLTLYKGSFSVIGDV